MDANCGGHSGFEHGGGSLLYCPSSEMFTSLASDKVPEMTISSESMSKSWNGVNSFFSGGWNPLVSMAPNVEFKDSPMASQDQINSSSCAAVTLKCRGIDIASHLIQYPSDPSLGVPNISCLGSGDGCLSQPNCCQLSHPLDCTLEENGIEKIKASENGTDNCGENRQECHISDYGGMEPSHNGKKRKRMPNSQSQFAQLKNIEAGQQVDKCPEVQEKQRTEQRPVANMHGKLKGKEVENPSSNGEASKEDCIHGRAKRGQATNSHSLAERVRREKISERMKFLQDLVPGCNKIAGKAVMLDEIINYVQSLQRQVEFLSMKLATVYPEMRADIERILLKDIHHSQGCSAAIPQIGSGMNSSCPIPLGILQGALLVNQNSDLQSTPIPLMPSMWEDELQSMS